MPLFNEDRDGTREFIYIIIIYLFTYNSDDTIPNHATWN